MKTSLLRSTSVLLLLMLIPLVSSPAGKMKMSVPMALKGVMTEVVHMFLQKHPEIDIELAFNNPKEQERLVRLGLPVDIIVSQEKFALDKMEKDGLLVPGSVGKMLINNVVIVTSTDSDFVIKDPAELVSDPIKKFSICSDSVVFCKKVHDYLTDLGLPDSPGDSMVVKDTEKGAIDMVKSGEAVWTFCNTSDAAHSKRLRVIWYVLDDPDLNPSIYYGAIVAKSQNVEVARQFFAIQDTSIAKLIYQNTGLITRNSPPPKNPPPPPVFRVSSEPPKTQTQTQPQSQTQTGPQTQTAPQTQRPFTSDDAVMR